RLAPEAPRIPETAPHVPATLDLTSTGGLGVVGPRERTVGVLAGVVAQVTALPAPGEADLVLLADADRLDDWSWARWLPHLGTDAVHLAPAAEAGAPAAHPHQEALAALVTAVIARRRAITGPSGRPGPAGVPSWLVVVVDRALDAPTAAALRAGRDVGVVVLAAAEA